MLTSCIINNKMWLQLKWQKEICSPNIVHYVPNFFNKYSFERKGAGQGLWKSQCLIFSGSFRNFSSVTLIRLIFDVELLKIAYFGFRINKFFFSAGASNSLVMMFYIIRNFCLLWSPVHSASQNCVKKNHDMWLSTLN